VAGVDSESGSSRGGSVEELETKDIVVSSLSFACWADEGTFGFVS
jgi:hypothetical protein